MLRIRYNIATGRSANFWKHDSPHSAIGAFYEVYNTLGFGFLEHIYRMALERELVARGHRVAREVPVRVMYKGEGLGIQRIDLIVDAKLVVETKSSYHLHRAAPRQLYRYLHATNLEVGLLFHFGPEPRFYREVSTNPTTCHEPIGPNELHFGLAPDLLFPPYPE